MTDARLRFELDVPECQLTYSVAPCTAALGVTDDGLGKCKNSPATCQDPENYDPGTKTLKWVKNTGQLSETDESIPSLIDVNVNAQRIHPGENLGKRERATASFKNHPYNDLVLDPYIDDRNYNPFEQGTFWGKFASIYPNLQGYEARVIREYTNDDGTTDTETTTYHAESGSMSGDMSGYSIAVRDVLTFVEGNKTLAPAPNNGTIDRDLNDTTDDTLVLEPAGIGDDEYAASGEYSMGDEYGTFTRSGDTITLTSRGDFGSEIETHDTGDTFQQALVIDGKNFSDILTDLLAFTDTPQAYIDNSKAQWDEEAAAQDSRLYVGRVAEPTEVHKLIGELMQDLGLNIYSDIIGKRIVARVIRPQTISTTLTDDVFTDGGSRKTLTDQRISAAYIRYGRRNPLEKMDEPGNYVGRLIRFNDDENIALQELTPSIRTHFSRWIPSTLRASASDTAALMVDRYGQAPQAMTRQIPREFSPDLAEVVNVESRLFEDQNGDIATVPMQVVKVDKGIANNTLTLEEYRVQPREAEGVHLVSLTNDELNMGGFADLRALHDDSYGTGTIPDNTEVIFSADPDVVFGSDTIAEFSVLMGDWPELANGVTLEIRNLIILGKGGDGSLSANQLDGQDGGAAFFTDVAVTLKDCEVGGGAGGGGGALTVTAEDTLYARGGGGAGRQPGSGFESGTDSLGGDGENTGGGQIGGDGGDIGQDGQDGQSGDSLGTGGTAGVAIDGFSHVTIDGTTVNGSTIN